MRPFGIREQVLFVALAPVVTATLLFMLYFTLLRYDDMETSLLRRGTTIARQLAPAAEYGMFSGNMAELKRLTLAVARESDVTAVAFFDPQGKLLAVTGTLRAPQPPNQLPDQWMARSNDGRNLFFHALVTQISKTSFDDPFIQPGSNTGTGETLVLGSLTLELSTEQLLTEKRETLLVTLLASGIILAGATLLAVRLGRDITIPVQALEEAVARISQGEMSVRIAPHKAQTLNRLEEGVNVMAKALDAARINSNLALASSQAELIEQHEFAEALRKAQTDAGVCVMVLEDNRLIYINDAALVHSGFSREEALAYTDLRPLFKSHVEALSGRGLAKSFQDIDSTRRFIARFRRKDGEWRFFDVAASTLPRIDHLRIVIIALDITQRKQDERRLAAANIKLRRQKEEAERANLAKSRFLAAASHDLRQPLIALSLFVTEIRERSISDDELRLARQISAATDSLTELLDALLDISRSDLAATRVYRQSLPLQPLLEAAIESHRYSAKEKGLEISVCPTTGWVDSDPQLLGRIIRNLTSNAIRYTQNGRVLLGVRHAKRHLRIEVWDSGIGIAPEHQPYLFDEFFQVANPERDTNKGLGLGLSIVGRLVDALGHTITVRSWKGKGSCFAVTVPRSQPSAPDSPMISPAIPYPKLNAQILLIDSDDAMRAELTRLLLDWGCEVTHLGNKDKVITLPQNLNVAICTLHDLERLNDHRNLPPLILLSTQKGCSVSRPLAGQLHYPPRPAQLRALLQHILDTTPIT